MFNCRMRQMEERHVANQVDLMVWSDRLDLLALSNFKGEVQVHRLHWQKVWKLPAPKENVSIQAMAWRPDGKALAIGYSFGSVYLVDIEDKEILDKYDFEQENSEELFESKNYGITCITWAVKTGILESATDYNLYDDASIFLQKPPSLGNAYKNQSPEDTTKSPKEIQEHTQLNMLMIGYGTGHIYMSVFGKFSYGTMHLAQICKDECGEYKVININLSDDFSVMQVLYLDRVNNNMYLSVINTSVLSAFSEELFSVAKRHGQITQLISHLDQTMVSITESWEHILLEMDTKMASYASSVPEGGVSADFLELLMLGVPSDELELFLLHGLTAKGLKKFGGSVELSYSTIQKLVLKQLNIVGQCLTYHLAELRGLTRIPDRYKILGLDESTVTNAIRACCAFLNKCLELQQVIDVSMRNYKAFFRWLFVVIVRLLDEPTSNEIVRMTQQELSHISDFLYNFIIQKDSNDKASDKPVKFNLERLAQYLQDQDLTLLPDDEDNPWHKFIRENTCLLKGNDTIFSMMEFRKFSLVQQQNYLKNAINKVFDVSGKDIGKYFSVLYNIKCYDNFEKNTSCDHFRVTQMFDANQQKSMVALINTKYPTEGIRFISLDIKERQCSATAGKYYFSSYLLQDTQNQSLEEELSVLDIDFYSPDYLSVLTKHPQHPEKAVFMQLPLKIALENSCEFNIKSKSCVFSDKIPKKNISPLLDQGTFKILEKMDGYRLAVSGGRKVSVILSNSQRKVRVYEMDVNAEDEDDESFDITLQSQDLENDQNASTSAKQDTTGENITF